MSVKVILYVIVAIVTLFAMDSLNINGIFKQGRVLQARIFFMLLLLFIIYLVTNFICDFFLASKMIY